jgi:hypothetical protein
LSTYHPVSLWAPQNLNELPAVLPELRRRQAGPRTLLDHIEGSGAGFLDIASQEERFCNERVARNRGMRDTERLPDPVAVEARVLEGIDLDDEQRKIGWGEVAHIGAGAVVGGVVIVRVLGGGHDPIKKWRRRVFCVSKA